MSGTDHPNSGNESAHPLHNFKPTTKHENISSDHLIQFRMSVKDAGRQKKYKVCIIGAGAAGLSAANSLVKNGIQDFLILEARNRIGGRILSLDMSGSSKVELGANWIHGVLGNPIFELAISHGVFIC